MKKKKFFSYLFMGLLAAGSTGMVSSCKDYDDDIQGLQEQISANKSAIEKIQALIASGSVITSVEKSATGVTVKLSNGNSFDISNGVDGKDGVPGTVWTIGDDGYWRKDGVKTEYYALGTKGDPGEKGEPGEKGDKGDNGSATAEEPIYYVPNAFTGCFDKYQGDKKIGSTNISFRTETVGAITAAVSKNTLTFTGVSGIEGGVYVLSLDGNLRSLVFMPKLYLDGIETVVYPYMDNDKLVMYPQEKGKNYQGKDVSFAKGEVDYGHKDGKLTCSDSLSIGPVWTVDYHANPSNVNIVENDIVGFNVLEPEAIYYNTRAAVSTLGVSAQTKNCAGEKIFKFENGTLTAGLQIAHPEKLNAYPTTNIYNKVNTIALQVNTRDAVGTVTSDYALLQPERAELIAINWAKAPMYVAQKESGRKGDMECNLTKEKTHLWDSPMAALQDADGAALELCYDPEVGELNLLDYLNIHYKQENVKLEGHPESLKSMTPAEAAEWGLRFHFKLMDYTVDDNKTHDSRYASFKNGTEPGVNLGKSQWYNESSDGIIIANNVDEEGAVSTTSRTAVGREPLVQVTVTDTTGIVLLDGYILIHITDKVLDNKEIAYEPFASEFDLCNAFSSYTTWAQFNKIVLTDGLGNLKKETFDANYEIDFDSSVDPQPNIGGTTGEWVKLKQFDQFKTAGDLLETDKPIGEIWYNKDTEGTTNHVFLWEISETEAEELLHHNMETTVTRWVRYVAKNGSAQHLNGVEYPYIYIKLTYKITRKPIGTVAFPEKISNYWFDLTGADGGKDAIANDVREPRNGANIKVFTNNINATLFGTPLNLPTGTKYYVLPNEKEHNVIIKGVGPDTTTYTVCGRSNELVCKYTAGTHRYNSKTLDGVLNTCAIDFTKGVFANNEVVAVPTYKKVKTENDTTVIATLNQTTGILNLVNNDVTKTILNAVGYKENHEWINKQMRAWIGYVGCNGCDVATKATDGIFLASWERPINIGATATIKVDANTNGNYIYMLEILDMFDWRGHSMKGNMGGLNDEVVNYNANNTWFWAYYGVKCITVDLTPSKVTTNLHNGVLGSTTLASISTQLHLSSERDGLTPYNGECPFKDFDISSYNSESQNEALLDYMKANKKKFGYIYYENNGENVTEFTVRVPITVEYTWGKFTTKVDITIKRTLGN